MSHSLAQLELLDRAGARTRARDSRDFLQAVGMAISAAFGGNAGQTARKKYSKALDDVIES